MTRQVHAPPSGVRLLTTEVDIRDTRPPPSRIAVRISAEGETIHVQVSGEIDLATAPELASHLSALGQNGDLVSLDLAGVTFIDLAGLRVLLEARMAGRQLRIAVPGHACERLLELTGTTALLSAG